MNPEIDTNFVSVERAVFETAKRGQVLRWLADGDRFLYFNRDNHCVAAQSYDGSRFWLNVDFYPNARAI